MARQLKHLWVARNGRSWPPSFCERCHKRWTREIHEGRCYGPASTYGLVDERDDGSEES